MIHIAVGDVNVMENEVNKINDLRQQFSNRPLWMAASIHRGEEQGTEETRGQFCAEVDKGSGIFRH